MKKSLFFFALLVALAIEASAQNWVNPLPTDSTTHRVVYTGVIEVPGVSKTELYSRAREWFSNSFGSSKAVLEMDDREDGKLIGNANSQFMLTLGGMLPSTPMLIWRKIRIEVKDGRYRYTLSDFDIGAPTASQTTAKPIEGWFNKPSDFTKDGSPKKAASSVIGGIQRSSEGLISSLKSAMNKSKEKDW